MLHMQHRGTALTPMLCLLLAGVANAQQGRPERPRPGGEQGGRGNMARLLKEFDKDGDGRLNEEERAAAREARRTQRDRAPQADREARSTRDRDRAQQRDRSDRQRGDRDEARRRGRGDEARGDQRRPARPGGDERADRQRGPRGPERGAREGRGDRPREARQGDQARRGPQGRGFGYGFGPPSSSAMFDRFDRNNDDQLSRAEFEAMSRAVRRTMGSFGPRGPRGLAWGGGPWGSRQQMSQWSRGGGGPRYSDRRDGPPGRGDGFRGMRRPSDRGERVAERPRREASDARRGDWGRRDADHPRGDRDMRGRRPGGEERPRPERRRPPREERGDETAEEITAGQV
jgi:hypothetical protein